VAVALEVAEADRDKLTTQDAAIRDAIANTLAAQSVAELTRLDARESIKAALKVEIAEAAHITIERVYLPQYVLQ
jgi:flagellar basal body-associated protein FliL